MSLDRVSLNDVSTAKATAAAKVPIRRSASLPGNPPGLVMGSELGSDKRSRSAELLPKFLPNGIYLVREGGERIDRRNRVKPSFIKTLDRYVTEGDTEFFNSFSERPQLFRGEKVAPPVDDTSHCAETEHDVTTDIIRGKRVRRLESQMRRVQGIQGALDEGHLGGEPSCSSRVAHRVRAATQGDDRNSQGNKLTNVHD